MRIESWVRNANLQFVKKYQKKATLLSFDGINFAKSLYSPTFHLHTYLVKSTELRMIKAVYQLLLPVAETKSDQNGTYFSFHQN